MASFGSWTALRRDYQPTIRKVNDALYEFYRPADGFINMNIVFFHGLHRQNTEDAYEKTWMLADESACWLNTWLAEEFPLSRILSVSYDASTEISDSKGRMDMHLVGENLVHSIIGLEEINQDCPVVFVGHCVGGLVLKEVCVRADQMGARDASEWQVMNPYKTFLTNMKGAFFYSTAGLGCITGTESKQRGPLLAYLALLSKETARLNSEFTKLRTQFGWKTFGVSEANETEDCRAMTRLPDLMSRLFSRKPRASLMVEEGSARPDMDEFCVLPGEDSFTICRPKDRLSSNFLLLVNFARKLLQIETATPIFEIVPMVLHLCGKPLEAAREQWLTSLHFPLVYVHMPRLVKKTIKQLRLQEAEPSRISLVGMGGIGKSTLAKAILREIGPQFEYVCFVPYVKERLARHDLEALVAKNLYHGSGRKVQMRDGDVQSLWLLLKGKKALLIMDNVDSEELISSLLKPNWCAKGSRLIITSRVGSPDLMPTFAIHEVPFLSMPESVELFSAYLSRGTSAEVREKLPDELLLAIIMKCDGLPLSLEVISSYLRNQTHEDTWICTLEKLRRAESVNGSVNDRLWSKLRVSFDDLAPAETRMFLDLAVLDDCDPLVPQYDLAIWLAVWKSGLDGSVVASGLRNLQERSFIVLHHHTDPVKWSALEELRNIGQMNDFSTCTYGLSDDLVTTVRIHQQLRDMAKNISRPPQKKVELCRGVWQMDDVETLLQTFKGDDAETQIFSAPGVVVDHGQEAVPIASQREFCWSFIGQLHELRLLRLSSIRLIKESAQRFPSKLAFLHLTSCSRGHAKKFWFLESDSWPIREEDVAGLQSLTFLLLDNCNAVRLPSNFHKLSKLKILIICGKQMSTSKLPQEFGRLPALEFLFLDNIGISKLPESFLELSKLQSFTLRGCSNFKTWPVPRSVDLVENAFSPLCGMTRLTLEGLPSLTELPETFGLMGSLEDLEILNCTALKKLPSGFSKLPRLVWLHILGCDRLESLCESFGELIALSILTVESCPSLRRLPDSIGHLPSLQILRLHYLNVSNLPASIEKLEKISCLTLSHLHNLRRLPDSFNIPTLETISIESCIRLESLPDSFGHLANLRLATILSCPSLQSLPNSMGRLTSLGYLEIAGCRNLRYLPPLGQLKRLEMLTLRYCQTLERLPRSLGQLKSLEVLTLDNCASLNSLPESIEHLQALHTMNVVGNQKLQSLPNSLGQLKSLKQLYVPLRLRSPPLQVEYLDKPSYPGWSTTLKFLGLRPAL